MLATAGLLQDGNAWKQKQTLHMLTPVEGSINGKGFLGGLILLAFFDSCVKSLSKVLRQEVPKVYISACFDGFKQALGDRWEAGIVEGVEGSLLRRISLRRSL